MLHGHDLLLFPLFYSHFPLDFLLLPLFLLLVLLLDDGDALVEFGQQMGQFGVDLVGEVGEIGLRLVVDALEEHHRGEIFLEVLDLVPGHFPLQNVDDVLLLGGLDFLGQLDHLVLERNDCVDVPTHLLHSVRVQLDDESADDVDLGVGADGDLVDEVSDGQLSTLGEDVHDVATLDV